MLIFYDCEVFRHDWLVVFVAPKINKSFCIHNDRMKLIEFWKKHKEDIWCSYNGRHYDQWVIKGILAGFNPYDISNWIIQKDRKGWEFDKELRNFELNNFDIMTGVGESLKQLEGMMGHEIKESNIPWDLDRSLTKEELKETIEYCHHDVKETIEVFKRRKEEFESHYQLIKMFNLPMKYISKTKAQLSSIILGAKKETVRNDEWDISFPNTLRINKYQEVLEWYSNTENHDYDKKLKIDVSGVPHIFGWGGLHGAKKKVTVEGNILFLDAASFYPALMIEYDYLSRNVQDKKKYRRIRDKRIEYKKQDSPLANPLKIVLNSTFGASNFEYSDLYDPRQAHNICIGGQLLLLDLIETLEPYWELIQSNTDGLFGVIKDENDFTKILSICKEWETRTRMVLEYKKCKKIIQKDVNSYLAIYEDGKVKGKGAYVKKLSDLSYDLPILNKAVCKYLLEGKSIRETIEDEKELKSFQKIFKLSGKYGYLTHGEEKLYYKTVRVFASLREEDGGLFKVKVGEGKNPEKVANTPEKCFIDNGNVNGKEVPEYLDKSWYIKLAEKRAKEFIG